MGRMQRDKGKRGEREFLNQLGQLINQPLDRNLNQSANGGADCLSLRGYAIEVKRCEKLAIAAWWKQATVQAAQAAGAVPLLAYRQSRKSWSVVLPLEQLTGHPSGHTETISLPAFAEVVAQRY